MAESYVVKGSAQIYNANSIVEDKGVLALITDWSFKDKDPQTIILKLKFLSGKKKGMFKDEHVTFDPKSNFRWKYAALRAGIGEPILENDAYDLMELVNKYVIVDLLPSRDGKFQNVEFRKYNETLLEGLVAKVDPEDIAVNQTSTPTVAEDEAAVSGDDDDLPF